MYKYRILSTLLDSNAEAYFTELCEALDNNSTDISEYFDAPLSNNVFHARITAEKRIPAVGNYEVVLVCTVYTFKRLNKYDKKSLLEEISGQYSDGWGECFEQNSICDDYLYDESDDGIFISPWSSSKSWKIWFESAIPATVHIDIEDNKQELLNAIELWHERKSYAY